jgi:hypothetical protein
MSNPRNIWPAERGALVTCYLATLTSTEEVNFKGRRVEEHLATLDEIPHAEQKGARWRMGRASKLRPRRRR